MMRRRTIHLTLAWGEWYLIAQELGWLPQTAESCAPAIAALQARLAETEGYPDELFTIGQPPLNWSPLVFALSLHVLHDSTLLPVAERLRNQMEMQTRRIEGAVRPEDPAELRRWAKAPFDGREGMATAN